MVKTTYALTLFAAVSLAAPVAQLTGRAEKQGSVEHKNLIQDIPILGPMLGGKQEQDAKRDESQPQHHNIIDGLPIIGKLIGNQNQRRNIGTEGISGLPIIGGLFGKHTHTGGENGMNKRRSFGQNYGQNAGQNHGQNAGQNQGQNEGQNKGQNYGQNQGQNEGQNQGQNEGQNQGQNYGQNAGQNAGQNYGQNQGQNEGQNKGQNYGQNYGQNEGQNEGQNQGQNGGEDWKRDLESSLSSIPIVGGLLGKNQDKPSHQQIETPAKHLDTRQAGHSKGVFGILQSLTSSGPISSSHKRDEFEQLDLVDDVVEGAVGSGIDAASGMRMRRNELAAPKASNGQQGNQKGAENQKGKESSSSGGLLGELMGKNGLGAIKGHSQHGVGLFPMRRDEKELEARGQAPIQGSTLTAVLLEGGALGKVTNMLSGGAMPKPGSNSPSKIGDGSTMGPPNPASGAGPHSGPGLVGEQKKGSGAV